MPTPKIVFAGTAMATITSVSQNACCASGVVTASQAGAEPVLERPVEDEPHRKHEQQPRGSRARSSAVPARDALPLFMARPSRATRRRDPEQHARSEITSSTHRDGRRGRRAVALDLAEDEHRRDLGLERQVARDQHDASRTRRSRGRSRAPTPARIAGRRFGRMIRRKTVTGPAPSEAAASSISRSSSSSTGCTERTTNGSVTNSSASRTPARVKATSMPTGPFGPYRASSVSPATIVGQRERQVDERVDDSLAAELVAHEHPGDERARHRVDRRHDQRDDQQVSLIADQASGP